MRPVRHSAAGAAVLTACMLSGIVSPARAQDIEPRAYSNARPAFRLSYNLYGVSARTRNNYDLVGVAWQYRWGGGL